MNANYISHRTWYRNASFHETGLTLTRLSPQISDIRTAASPVPTPPASSAAAHSAPAKDSGRHDGYSQPREVHALPELGIGRIDLQIMLSPEGAHSGTLSVSEVESGT
jgi:hypothetical protein